MASACGRTIFLNLAIFVTIVCSSMTLEAEGSCNSRPRRLSFYLQQENGVNELMMVPPARPPVPGTFTGFGQEQVYEFVMTQTEDPASPVMGYVRGTAVVVNNTATRTVFAINNVVHFDFMGLRGTLSQQGEAAFTDPSWEYAIVGGTGAFRMAKGYSVGRPVSLTRTPSGSVHIVTHYDAFFSLRC
ncbi:hypothetical protein KP509_07G009000 [Ceratopteris richardii]|uniref:Dirigent protein n=1 Tax=Ceratopteris richardii TaxID=49495 RepID=A0A8T2UE91_CERRI|nr:hypothetical protein KP509_07G009000 [Ceratopteris richardii]